MSKQNKNFYVWNMHAKILMMSDVTSDVQSHFQPSIIASNLTDFGLLRIAWFIWIWWFWFTRFATILYNRCIATVKLTENCASKSQTETFPPHQPSTYRNVSAKNEKKTNSNISKCNGAVCFSPNHSISFAQEENTSELCTRLAQ